MKPGFRSIVAQFMFEGEFLDVRRCGIGHINGTYAARFRKPDGSVDRYILQRINHGVFKHPEELMHNIEKVTVHLRQKIIAAGGDTQRETLNLIPTVDGQSFYRTAEGNYWRGYVFIEGARTYPAVEHPDHFHHAGRAFGRFLELVSDLPPEQLYETIPDFHHTRRRFEALVQSVERDVKNRARLVRAEIGFVERRAKKTSVLVDLLARGELSRRITHNDTKFNNVMIDDATGEGICVVDLDTVMPGLALYDFGDAIRSGANPATEDERDLARVSMDLDLYDRFARGYLETAHDFLTHTEVAYLPFSAWLMTLECGMRFLADYLDGDVYFGVHRPRHNLDRCRTQFKMVQDMEAKFDRMVRIVERYR
jgi:Ser/Thr protein kinase RdoA (MazF antagonist)